MATRPRPGIDPQKIPDMFKKLSEFAIQGGFGRGYSGETPWEEFEQAPQRTPFEKWRATQKGPIAERPLPGQNGVFQDAVQAGAPPLVAANIALQKGVEDTREVAQATPTRQDEDLPGVVKTQALAVEFLKAHPDYLAFRRRGEWEKYAPDFSEALKNTLENEGVVKELFWAAVEDLKAASLEQGGGVRFAPPAGKAGRASPPPTNIEPGTIWAGEGPMPIGGERIGVSRNLLPTVPRQYLYSALPDYLRQEMVEGPIQGVTPGLPDEEGPSPADGVTGLSDEDKKLSEFAAQGGFGRGYSPDLPDIDPESVRVAYLAGSINHKEALDILVGLWISQTQAANKNYDPNQVYSKNAIDTIVRPQYKKIVDAWGLPGGAYEPLLVEDIRARYLSEDIDREKAKELYNSIPGYGDADANVPLDAWDLELARAGGTEWKPAPREGWTDPVPAEPVLSPEEYREEGYTIEDAPNFRVQWDGLSRNFFKRQGRPYSKRIQEATDRNFHKAYGGFELQRWRHPDEDLPEHLQNFTWYVEKGYDEPGEKFYDNERIADALRVQLDSSQKAYYPREDEAGLERMRRDMAQEIVPEVAMLEFLTNGTRTGAIASAKEEYYDDKLVTQPHVGFLYWVKANKPAIWGSVEREDGSLVALWEKKERQMQRSSRTKPLFESFQQRLAR